MKVVKFKAVEGCNYKFNYDTIFKDITLGKVDRLAIYKSLILNDLWFIVYFVLGIEIANHPFVVGYCREVEDGGNDYTLDLVAREHFKTTIITKAEVVQRLMKDRNGRIGIFSHTRPAAKSFLRSIKAVFEQNELLKRCFPDVLYKNPAVESPKWSEDDGLILRREDYYNEASLEAWGLIEGMPTGKHFTHRVYDDVETQDLVYSPEVIMRLKQAFDLSQNLGTYDGTHRVVGTPYHHDGVLMYVKDKKGVDGSSMYRVRLKTATVDGSANGKPVFLSEERLNVLKCNEYQFNCQQLCNPTPIGNAGRLKSGFLREIHPDNIPKDVWRFMVIDPAGGNVTRRSDAWAILLVGVEPKADMVGASNIYILDAVIQPMTDSQAIEEIVRMYLNGGIIRQVGVEKVGLSSVEVHVANALVKCGRHISIENKTLVILTPAGRKKETRILQALEWGLNNGKIHISQYLNSVYKERLKKEMDNFPYWQDDGLDALSYVYDMIKGHHFSYYSNKPLEVKRAYAYA